MSVYTRVPFTALQTMNNNYYDITIYSIIRALESSAGAAWTPHGLARDRCTLCPRSSHDRSIHIIRILRENLSINHQRDDSQRKLSSTAFGTPNGSRPIRPSVACIIPYICIINSWYILYKNNIIIIIIYIYTMCHVWSSTKYYQNRGGFSGPGSGKIVKLR